MLAFYDCKGRGDEMTEEHRDIVSAYFEKPERTSTVSNIPLKELYTPGDVADLDYKNDIADAGEFPYTRGIHPTMYRGKLWTRRVGWGYGTPKDTNQQLKFLLREGNSALTIFPDLALVEGIDPDHPLAKGEVGRVGVAYYSIEDMAEMMEGIPLHNVSMTLLGATCAAPVIFSLYLAVAKSRGIDFSKLRGTTANDPLHSHHCRSKEANPIDLALKTAVDVIEFSTKYVPLWNPVSVNSYDMRDMGINAPQEIAFGLAIAMAYVRGALDRGLEIDNFAPRLSFYCNAGSELFEEVAKLRAMRRIWARIMKHKFGAKDEASLKFRFATHTSGSSLTQQQPLNNLVRIAYQQLAAVLGGAQSANSCSFVEALSVPTELSQRLALRTQQILAYETGVPLVADPLGGSYYIENLTDTVEEKADAILEEIEDKGGWLEATRTGWIEREVEAAAMKYQEEVESKERIIVGVNEFVSNDEDVIPGGVLAVPPTVEEEMISRIESLRQRRDAEQTKRALDNLSKQAKKGEKANLIPFVIEAVEANATMEEIMGTMRVALGYSYDPFGMREVAA